MTAAGRMKQAPAARRPGVPARSLPTWIAISVEFGPGIRFTADIRSTNSSRDIQPRRRTTSSSIIATCAAGPPNDVRPSLRKSDATSRTFPGGAFMRRIIGAAGGE